MPAIRAVANTFPLAIWSRAIRSSVCRWRRILPLATARRLLMGLAETSTILASPLLAMCVRVFNCKMCAPGILSTADGDHLPVGLIVVAKVVLLRFPSDYIEKELLELVVSRAGAQRFHDIKLERAAETRAQFAVAGQPQFVAALAEMQVGHRADKTDPLAPARDLIVNSGAVGPKFALRDQIAVNRFDEPFRFANRQKIIFVEHSGRADRHHFNEAQN